MGCNLQRQAKEPQDDTSDIQKGNENQQINNNNKPLANEKKQTKAKNKNVIVLRKATNINLVINFEKNADEYFSKDDIIYYRQLKKKVREEEEKNQNKINDKVNIQTYKLGQLLGQGSFGNVYMGFDTQSGMAIAVKQVPLNLNQDEVISYKLNLKYIFKQKIKSLQKEISLLQNLHHENIVQYYGTYKDKQTLNIFLEYVSGGSLCTHIKNFGLLNENIIRIYAMHILKGLEYLHFNNIVHRDIKGANVLVDNKGICKLADFGTAQQICKEFVEQQQSMQGTPNWMAPEIIKNQQCGRFSDIWSFGCTMIELVNFIKNDIYLFQITGKPPFSEENGNPFAIMYMIAQQQKPIQIPQNISQEFHDFISQCLKYNPKERANVRQLINHDFFKKNEEIIKSPSRKKQKSQQFDKNNFMKQYIQNMESEDLDQSSVQSKPGLERQKSSIISIKSPLLSPKQHTIFKQNSKQNILQCMNSQSNDKQFEEDQTTSKCE